LEDPELSEIYFYNSLAVLEPAVDEITATYLHLIETYKMTNANDKISEAYKSALVLDSENLFLNYGLAYTYDHYLGNKNDALEYYQIFSQLAVKNRLITVICHTPGSFKCKDKKPQGRDVFPRVNN
jgi:hypothetical protein